MPQYPSFYLLGFVCGVALWLIGAPTPFPFLAAVLMGSGACGLVLSIAYVRSFAPRQWRMTLVRWRRIGRALDRAFDPAPPKASEIARRYRMQRSHA
jgi:hypothetical protein